SGDEPEVPQAFVAAGAHHDPGAAIRGALAEVVTNLCYVNRRAATEPGWRDVNRLRRLLSEPVDVVTLDDHVGVNTLPEARPRLEAMVGMRRVEPPAPGPGDGLGELLTPTVERLVPLVLAAAVGPRHEP